MRGILIVIGSLLLASSANAGPTWPETQRACGTEYREADKASRPTWADFLNECKVRKGFVSKRSGGEAFRLPDVPKN